MKKKNERSVIVPCAWVVYDIGDITMEELSQMNDVSSRHGAPNVAVMEAMVMMGRAKRVAAIHTFNSMANQAPDEEHPTNIFGEEED